MTGILGGSFDPPHEGHLQLARAVTQELGLKKLLFLPANRNPHKNATGAGAAERLRMLELALEGQDPRFEIEPMELLEPPPSFTIDSLLRLQAREPGDYTLILGQEVFADFLRWKDPQTICDMVDLAIIRRHGVARVDLKPLLLKLGYRSLDDGAWVNGQGKKVWDLELPLVEASSTAIRQGLQSLSPQQWMSSTPPVAGLQRAVWLFIKEFRLYTVK